MSNTGLELQNQHNFSNYSWTAAKEHIFAGVLVERSESFTDLPIEELERKIGYTYGRAALDILKVLDNGSDLICLIHQYKLNNYFELSNYAKNYFGDTLLRRSLLMTLCIGFLKSNQDMGPDRPGLEILVYAAEAIGFLAKDKIQFIADMQMLFSQSPENESAAANEEKTKLWTLLDKLGEKESASQTYETPHVLKIGEFVTALQETADSDRTDGESLSVVNQGGFESGFRQSHGKYWGEKAYWDIFFWLSPGIWLTHFLPGITVRF